MINKNKLILLLLPVLVSLFIFGCKDATEIVGGGNIDNGGNDTTTTGSPVIVSGQVINNLTGSPLDSATVLFIANSELLSVLTDNQGKFSEEVNFPANTNLTLITFKNGFKADTTDVFVNISLKTAAVPLIKLNPQSTSTGVPSGDPVSIFVSSQSSTFIGVKESGSEETARIVFTVHDSAGVPVDLDHSVDVHFRFGAAPGGGEVLSPAKVKTNSNGEVAVNLTAGTKAGAVQLIAEIFLENKKITSLPVGIAIHGGLPDYEHFSIAPALVNFPGYNVYGLKDQVSAYVGDKYANPVRPGTSVYFTTTGGIIDGSTLTNEQGIGSVDLISAAPQPFHPILGAGFATVTATTADENQNNISRDIVVLFSGIPSVSASPLSFDIPNMGSQSFSFTVMDQNGNPIASGNTITVVAEGEDVQVQGDTQVSMPDTQSKSWTQFGFSLVDTDEEPVTRTVSVKISTEGVNGKASMVITGIVR